MFHRQNPFSFRKGRLHGGGIYANLCLLVAAHISEKEVKGHQVGVNIFKLISGLSGMELSMGQVSPHIPAISADDKGALPTPVSVLTYFVTHWLSICNEPVKPSIICFNKFRLPHLYITNNETPI